MASALLTVFAAVGGILSIKAMLSEDYYEIDVSLNHLFHHCDAFEDYYEINQSTT